MSSSDTSGQSGDAFFRQALELLDGLTFDAVRGGVGRRPNVFLSVVPEWEKGEDDTFSATVNCHATWHQTVDWSMMRVSARPETPRGFFVQHMLPLSPSGQATFTGLEPGTYVLRGYCRLAQFTAPTQVYTDSDERQSTELATGVAMDGSAASVADGELLTKSDMGADGVCVLIHRRGKRVAIEFATNSDDVAGKSIEFYVTDPNTNEVYLDAQEAAFGAPSTDAEFKYLTNTTELSFGAGVDVEVSYRINSL